MEEKLRFTLISLLLMLCGTMNFALAAIVNGVRQAPAPESTAFTTGSETNYYYLYNTSANMFFTQGNSWGTRACVGPYASAVKMYFAEPATPDGTYSIQNSVCIRNTTYSWKSASAEAAGHAFYCDQSTSWGRPYWTVVPQDDNVFRLVNSAPYFADGEEDTGVQLYMGRDDAVAQDFGNAYSGFTDDSERFPVSDQLTATAGHHVDWVLVTPDAYAAVADAWPVYEKAKELKAAIDEAKEKSLNVADEEAVYLEEASTIEQMDAAIASIKDKINHAAENTATPDNPADMTASITNASYDAGTKGWSGTAPAIGYTAAEFWQKNFNMYQDLTGLPNGVYAVKVKGYFRPGSTQDAYTKWATGKDLNAYLYAKAGEDSVAVALVNIFEGSTDQKLGVGTEYGPDGSANDGQSNYVPNNMQAGEAYFEAGRYQNIVFNAVDDGKLRIGLMKDDSNFSMNWTLFDQWELLYIGNSAEAYKFWADEMKKNVKAPVIGEETIFTQSYQDAYNTIITQETTATNKAEAIAEIIEVEDAVAAIRKNIALWKELQSVLADAVAVVANEALDPDYTVELGDWVEWDAPDILEARTLTNAELEDLIAQKKAEIDEAKKHPIGETDATNLLMNPDFDDARGATYGWTGFKSAYQIKWGNGKTSFQMPTDGGTATNKCVEAFSTTDFDLYQVVENVPVGVYEISVQGFCRNGRGSNAWNNYQNQSYYSQPGNFPVYVYLNDAQTPFVNVFSEPVEEGYYKSVDSGSEVYVMDGMEFPDGMRSSAVAFSEGMYTQKAHGLVAKEGDVLRIGVKGTSAGLDGEDDNWVIFDNFKLTWKGFQPDVVEPILEEQIAKAENETVFLAMDKDLYARLINAIDAAKASIIEGKGEIMFNCLSALYEIDAKVNASKLVFAELEKANKNLANEIEVATEAGRTSALADASTLNDQITSGIANHTIAEADVNTLIASINSMISRLRMPNQEVIDAASDDNPVDMTSIIQNPTYDEGVSGWAGDEAYWGGEQGAIVELFGKNYDYYQELSGLPAGTYEISVQAFYRSGSAENDYNTLGSVRDSHAFLYAAAINGTDSVMNAKAVQRQASITKDEDYIAEGFVRTEVEYMYGYDVVHVDKMMDTDNEYYLYTFVPNIFGTVNDQFMNGHFDNNKVVVKLAEGETLRIGLLKDTLVANDWTVFDNWRLTYFGRDSQKQPSGDGRIGEINDDIISETDATNLLVNPDFQEGETGWIGFREGHQVKYGDAPMPVTGGTATNTCVEAFSTDKFDLYQVVENAPVGVYEISVQGFCRNGRGGNAWNNYQNQSYYSQPGNFPVYVYLNDAQTPFVNVFSKPVEEGYYKSVDSGSEVYVMDGMEFPDGMRSSAVAFSEGMYTQKAHGLVAKEGDVLRIGVKGTSAGLDGEDDNWVIFDNFKLTWKGFQPDVVEPILEEQIAKAENETILFAMDKDLFTRLINAIDAAKASINEGKGETMFNCLSNLYEIGAKVNESKLVFAELENANKNLANEIEVATEAGRTSALVDASTLNEQITTGIANHTIAEDAVNILITFVNSMISRLRMPDQDKIDNASDFAPVDMTSLIQNPTYDEGVSGWLGTEAAWGGDQGAIAELFGKNYNYYQEFSGLPAGTYEVSVQAFYRSGSAVNDYNTLGSVRNSRAFLYAAAINDTASVMNAKAIQRLASITKNEAYIAEGFVQSVEESMEGYVVAHTDMIMDTDSGSYLRTFVPNTMGTANDQFMNGHFDNNKVIVKLAEGETLCIGLLKTTLVANDWTVFDNWRLTYFGRDSQLQPSGDERIFEIDDDIKGDANDDQQVTMSDVVAIVNYVLGRMNASFNFINADVNGNNEVTMADVVGVVNIVLGRNVSGARMAEPTTSLVPGTLTLNSKAGRLSVSLDNTSAYTAFQMDVTLPEGMSIDDVAFTGRATSSHVLSMNTLENGKVRITGWSARNADLKGNSGELLTMDLSGIEMVGTVIVDNVLFVTADGMEHKLNAAEIYGETTGISQMENGQRTMDNSYDLQGRKVNSHLKKGLYIINNKKVVVK